MIILLSILAVVGAAGGLAFALRANGQRFRRWVSIGASGLVLSSMGVFFYLPVLSDRFQRLSFSNRIDAAVPWVRSGLGLSLLALMAALVSVRYARLCLVLASLICLSLWYVIGAS